MQKRHFPATREDWNDEEMRVQVYWNIIKKTWSIRSKKTGRVIAWSNALVLDNCKFVVQQGGRARVLREKRKNVHAYIEGDIVGIGDTCNLYGDKDSESTPVTYNPYQHTCFVDKLKGMPVLSAYRAIFGVQRVEYNVTNAKVRICNPATGKDSGLLAI